MKAYLLDLGYLSLDENNIIAMKTKATLDDMQPPRVWRNMPVYAVLIEHEDGKFLFDVGCDPEINHYFKNLGSRHYLSVPYTCSKQQTLEYQLELCNTKIEDIKAIIVSHMHYDHVGYLPVFHGIDVYVNKDDYEASVEGRKTGESIAKYVTEPDVHFVPVSESFRLAKGIDVICIGSSHCKGLLGLLLEMEHNTLLFPSDVGYTKENWGPPFQHQGKPYDTLGTLKEAAKLLELADKKKAKIMYAHDQYEYETYKK